MLPENLAQTQRFDIGREQSCVLRLPKYRPPTPPSTRRVCLPPATKAGRRGGWGSIFWKTQDIGLASYSNNLYPLKPHPLAAASTQREERLQERKGASFCPCDS